MHQGSGLDIRMQMRRQSEVVKSQEGPYTLLLWNLASKTIMGMVFWDLIP